MDPPKEEPSSPKKDKSKQKLKSSKTPRADGDKPKEVKSPRPEKEAKSPRPEKEGDKKKKGDKQAVVHAENATGIEKAAAEAGIVIPNAVTEMSYAALAWEVAKQIGGSLSGDLLNSGISLPTFMMEPLTILQRGVEIFEYAKCLEKAAKCKSSINRMAFVAGFSCSPFSVTPDRFKTNFNPILGETFEYTDARFKSPVQVLAEQVSHHPPMAAMHARNKHWSFTQQYGAVTNFMVNQLDIKTDAQTHITFANGEHYYALNPKARVHNVVVGSMWLEHYGEIDITNLTTGERCVVEFPKAGFFADGPDVKISGYIFDKEGNKVVKLQGRWDEHLIGQWLVDTEDEGFKKGAKIQLWKIVPTDFTGRPYRLTNYAMTFNYFPDELKKIILTSDSRRRPDRLWLEQGDCDNATQWKRVAEYRQRMDENDRKAAYKKSKGEGKTDKDEVQTKDYWTPNWFKLENDHRGKPIWTFNGKYWEIAKKVAATGEPYIPDNVKDTSCDFAAYHKNFFHLVGVAAKPGDKAVNL